MGNKFEIYGWRDLGENDWGYTLVGFANNYWNLLRVLFENRKKFGCIRIEWRR